MLFLSFTSPEVEHTHTHINSSQNEHGHCALKNWWFEYMCCFLFQRVVSSALLVSREPVNFSSKVCGEDFAWILFGRMCFLEGNISKFRCINLNLTLSLPPRIGQPKIEYPLFSLQGWPKLTTKRPRCAKMEREFVPSNGPKIICILKVG